MCKEYLKIGIRKDLELPWLRLEPNYLVEDCVILIYTN